MVCLYHEDVIRLFAALLDNAKFHRVFSDKYPLILIDEYQDSLKPIIDRFLKILYLLILALNLDFSETHGKRFINLIKRAV